MKFGKLFWGFFFIGAAALVAVSQLGYLTSVNLYSLVITIFLIPIIIKSALHLNFAGILFPFAILGIIYAEPLGIKQLTPGPILAVALFGSIGLSIIFSKSKWYNHICIHSGNGSEGFEEIVNCPDEEVIDFKVSFGSSIKYVNTDGLKRTNLSASFGALKVYFDNTKLDENGAQINLDVSFGAVEMYIPKTWKIINNVNISLGGIEEKNSNQATSGPNVVLTGNVSLAGVEIIYV